MRKTLLVQMFAFLMLNIFVASAAADDFKVWKTLKIRAGIDGDGYSKAIKENGMQVGPLADRLLKMKEFSVNLKKEVELDLVIVTVDELGLKGHTLKDIFNRAKEKGLQLCPVQVGPELRLQYQDQPADERLIIGTDMGDRPFEVNNFLYRCLGPRYGIVYPTRRRPPTGEKDGRRFVFVRPRK